MFFELRNYEIEVTHFNFAPLKRCIADKMLCRRPPNFVTFLLIVGGLLVSIFFMKKIRELYDIHQKYYRLENYKQFMDEVSDYMKVVEKSANKSVTSLHQLNTVLQQQRQQPRLRNGAR